MMVRGRELPMRAWWAVGGIVVCLAFLTAVSIWYTNVNDQKQARRWRAERAIQDRQWCELLDTLSGGYRAAPPTTETGRRMAAAIEQLRARKGCL